MISVIIPAYNEENRIEKTVLAIEGCLRAQKEPFEILVVNDGSTDKTASVVNALENGNIRLLSYEKNKGKGGAVKYGVLFAAGDFICFTDADLPYPPDNIVPACQLLKDGYDVVLGRRYQKENGQKYPWYRTLSSKGSGVFVNLLLGLREKDTQCGFKAFRYKAAQEIYKRVTLSGWSFDAESIFIAKKQGFYAKIAYKNFKKYAKIACFICTSA